MLINKKQIRPLARLHGYWLYQRFLTQTQSWPSARRRAWVLDKLKRTLVRAYDGIAFYRTRFQKAGFNPHQDFNSLSDLQRVPLLTKDDARAYSEEMIDRR